MSQTSLFHIESLKKEFELRRAKNPSYSLRAYARSLRLAPATLSQILCGKRSVPWQRAANIAENIFINETDKRNFWQSLIQEKASGLRMANYDFSSEKQLDSRTYFSIISEWEYYAVLSLMETVNFEPSARWIAKRLEISPERAREVWKRLMEAGLIAKDCENKFKPHYKTLATSEDIESQALKVSHLNELELAKKKLLQVDVSLRDYSSHTMAIHPKNLPKAKKMLRQFRRNIAELIEDENATEVYQLCIQLFPLTQISNKDI